MKRFNVAFFIILCFISSAEMKSQDFDDFIRQAKSEIDSFRKESMDGFRDFREKANREYAAFLAAAWKDLRGEIPLAVPKEEEPVVPIPYDDRKKPPVKDRPIVIQETITPRQDDAPRPEPVVPVIENDKRNVTKDFLFFGTPMQVRYPSNHGFSLKGTDGYSLSGGWKQLSSGDYDNLVSDCLELRRKHRLNDWYYLLMINKMSESILGKSDAAILLTAFVYCQSGYQMRLGTDRGKLILLYSSRHSIYRKMYYKENGINFYPLNSESPQIRMSEASFPNERAMSLYFNEEPMLSVKKCNARRLTSKRYPQMSFDVSSNENLIDFFDEYPSSQVGGDFMTRWAMYAETPLSSHIRASLYPGIRSCIRNKNEREAVEMILNWVQTAFTYEYDEKVWGCDRAFFADETLHYPYCDCEDRSILFSRIVRDVLGLDVVLVYYPGHLATAVSFSDPDQVGDYMMLDGKKFIVCDPTFINAPVGMTMDGMDNKSAKVILLKSV